MKLVQITVNKEGMVVISTFGFPGKQCVAATQFLKDLLGEESFIKMKPTAFVPYVETKQTVQQSN